MTTSFSQWQIRATKIKLALGVLMLIGLIGAFVMGWGQPDRFYVAFGIVVLAMLFWGVKLVLLLRDKESSPPQ
jgi:uncharacterized membrane protein